MTQARYIMIGGFLGAGKTTAVLKLAEHFAASGRRVGLITNDQSVGLVDTAMLASHGFAVEEITGGCFCCRFNSLIDAAEKLSAGVRPEVFIAEPVGSCTDLKASVSYPLRRMYGRAYSVAPLTVLVDPPRALRILGLEPGKAFSPKVVYVYLKQLEEAEIIVVNKIDLLNDARRNALRDGLCARFPHARILETSARSGEGMPGLFGALAGVDLGQGPSMDIDYELYAEGEALLGWLNCTLTLSTAHPIDGNMLLHALAHDIRQRLSSAGAEIAHLKMTLAPTEAGSDIAVLNLVGNDQPEEMSHRLEAPVAHGELILNLRAEADPQVLADVVHSAIDSHMGLNVVHIEHFRPGKPQPTHRLPSA